MRVREVHARVVERQPTVQRGAGQRSPRVRRQRFRGGADRVGRGVHPDESHVGPAVPGRQEAEILAAAVLEIDDETAIQRTRGADRSGAVRRAVGKRLRHYR